MAPKSSQESLLLPLGPQSPASVLDGNYVESICDLLGASEDFAIAESVQIDDVVQSALRPVATASSRLHAAIAALLLFAQINFTGPEVRADALARLPSALRDERLYSPALASLTVDGEGAYSLARLPMLLVFARSAFDAAAGPEQKETAEELACRQWWGARAVRVHQQLLENPAATLRDRAFQFGTDLQAQSADWPSALRAQWHMERAIGHLQYKDDREVAAELGAARDASGLKFSVSGQLGKRTKFQSDAFTQLVLLAESSQTVDGASMPVDSLKCMDTQQDANETGVRTLSLNDDTLLEKPALEGDTRMAMQNLTVIDQCILLGYCQHTKNTNPSDGITTEQMFPYVRRVLENPNNWTVHTMALLERSRLESNKTRTVERAALQIQALVDQIPANEDEAPASQRLAHFFTVQCPPRWALEAELAEKMMGLGMIKTALAIFERLELWEKAVVCHILVEKRSKAEELVQRLLAEDPKNPRLLCLLGDVRGEPEHYHKAWEVSGGRHARAMRALGAHYYKVPDYAQSVECWLKALRINPLFEDAWFVCGCAALHTENWDVAQEAFSRCTALDHENAEAWNNLATVYIKLKQKPEALRSLKEGVKAKFDSWKMWTNYLYLAVDLGQLDDAMQAMSRVIALRAAAAVASANPEVVAADLVDVEVLQLVADGVLRVHAEQPSPTRVARVAALVQQAVDAAPAIRPVWLVAAHFYKQTREWRKAIDAHGRAYRCVARDTYPTYEPFRDAVDAARVLCEAYRDMGDMEVATDDPSSCLPACADWAYQSKLVVRALLGRGKDYDNETAYNDALQLMEQIKQAS